MDDAFYLICISEELVMENNSLKDDSEQINNEPLWEQNVLHMLHYYVFCEGYLKNYLVYGDSYYWDLFMKKSRHSFRKLDFSRYANEKFVSFAVYNKKVEKTKKYYKFNGKAYKENIENIKKVINLIHEYKFDVPDWNISQMAIRIKRANRIAVIISQINKWGMNIEKYKNGTKISVDTVQESEYEDILDDYAEMRGKNIYDFHFMEYKDFEDALLEKKHFCEIYSVPIYLYDYPYPLSGAYLLLLLRYGSKCLENDDVLFKLDADPDEDRYSRYLNNYHGNYQGISSPYRFNQDILVTRFLVNERIPNVSGKRLDEKKDLPRKQHPLLDELGDMRRFCDIVRPDDCPQIEHLVTQSYLIPGNYTFDISDSQALVMLFTTLLFFRIPYDEAAYLMNEEIKEIEKYYVVLAYLNIGTEIIKELHKGWYGGELDKLSLSDKLDLDHAQGIPEYVKALFRKMDKIMKGEKTDTHTLLPKIEEIADRNGWPKPEFDKYMLYDSEQAINDYFKRANIDESLKDNPVFYMFTMEQLMKTVNSYIDQPWWPNNVSDMHDDSFQSPACIILWKILHYQRMGILPNDYSVEKNKKSPEKTTRIAKSSESVMQQATQQFENMLSGKRDRSFIGIDILNQYKKISPHLLQATNLRKDVIDDNTCEFNGFYSTYEKEIQSIFPILEGKSGKKKLEKLWELSCKELVYLHEEIFGSYEKLSQESKKLEAAWLSKYIKGNFNAFDVVEGMALMDALKDVKMKTNALLKRDKTVAYLIENFRTWGNEEVRKKLNDIILLLKRTFFSEDDFRLLYFKQLSALRLLAQSKMFINKPYWFDEYDVYVLHALKCSNHVRELWKTHEVRRFAQNWDILKDIKRNDLYAKKIRSEFKFFKRLDEAVELNSPVDILQDYLKHRNGNLNCNIAAVVDEGNESRAMEGRYSLDYFKDFVDKCMAQSVPDPTFPNLMKYKSFAELYEENWSSAIMVAWYIYDIYFYSLCEKSDDTNKKINSLE